MVRILLVCVWSMRVWLMRVWLVRLLLACVATAFAWGSAAAWPDRTVRLIVPYPAGGGTDIVARVLAQKLSDAFRQQFIVDNRPGASGMVGAQIVARAEPDGYTLLVASPAEVALNPTLFKQMSYDPAKDLVPVTLLAWTPLVLAAHPSFEASNPAELIKIARTRQVDFSTPGIGSAMHLTGEYISKVAGLKLAHVPYRGAAPAVTDAVAGHVKLTIAGMPPVEPFLQSGQLKVLAVTSRQRSRLHPDIPAISETAGFEDADFTNWFGLLARAGTAVDILDRLQRIAAQALRDPEVRRILSAQAAEPVGGTSAEFRDFIHAEAAKYGKIVELGGIEGR
jgi:tripartite-type tricarboxylate transporter receptor subunit TctC